MNSSGDGTIWVVPSLYARISSNHDIAGAVTLEPFIGDRQPGDIVAQLLQFYALIGAPAHYRVDAKAVRISHSRRRWFVWARQGLQTQHLPPRSRHERDPVGARRCPLFR